MASFLDILNQLWSVPSVDASPVMREQTNVIRLQEAVENASTIQQNLLTDALKDYQYDVAVQADGTITAIDTTDRTTYVNAFMQPVNPLFRNGIFVTEDPKSRELNLVMDESDAIDYQMRYQSIDARRTTEDGSELSFMRIVKNNIAQDQVWPIYANGEAPQPGYTNNKFKQFILTQLSTASQERMQIVETNQEFQVLFYGQKPEILQLSGILKNTLENPWSMNMLFQWDEQIRGSRLVEDGNILQIYVDGELYTGYPFSFQRSKVAPNDFLVNFNMSFIVKNRISVYTTPL